MAQGIQADYKSRVVSLNNLEAMCERASGVCHRFWPQLMIGNGERFGRCLVWYSNPDEYGNEEPCCGVFPAWLVEPTIVSVEDEPMVCLDMVDSMDEREELDVHQMLAPVLNCPELFRDTPKSTAWRTRGEIESAKGQ